MRRLHTLSSYPYIEFTVLIYLVPVGIWSAFDAVDHATYHADFDTASTLVTRTLTRQILLCNAIATRKLMLHDNKQSLVVPAD